MKNLGIQRVALDDILMTVNNERQTWGKESFLKLLNSMRIVGQVNPVVIEKLDREIQGKNYRIIAGNRRFRSAKINSFEILIGRVFSDLSDDERVDIHVIENATKTKISVADHLDGYWDMYKILLTERLGFSLDEILSFNPKDYWCIDKSIRGNLTKKEFSNIMAKSLNTIDNAFLYQKINKRLQDLVQKGDVSCSAMLPFAKIDNKNEQIILYHHALRFNKRKLTNSISNFFVDDYLRRRDGILCDFQFSVGKERVVKKKDNSLSYLSELISLKKKFTYMLSVDENMFSLDVKNEDGGKLIEVIGNIKNRVSRLVEKYSEDVKFKDVVLEFEKNRKQKSFLEKILSGDVGFDEVDEDHRKVDLGDIEFLPSVSLLDIVPCKNQQRKTFNDKKICKIAGTIGKYGILQSMMLRPREVGYEIIVGEHRYWGAAEAGSLDIDALVVDVDDVSAHIIRSEEDLFEEVILSERAEILMENYKRKREINGPDYSLRKFSKEMSKLGTDSVYDALKYASLDIDTKKLHDDSLISFSHCLVLGDIDDVDLRRKYASYSIVLGWNVKELSKRIRLDKHQQILPFVDYNYEAERFKDLHSQVLNKLGGLSKILDDDKFENMGGKAFYRKLYELNELVGELK